MHGRISGERLHRRLIRQPVGRAKQPADGQAKQPADVRRWTSADGPHTYYSRPTSNVERNKIDFEKIDFEPELVLETEELDLNFQLIANRAEYLDDLDA